MKTTLTRSQIIKKMTLLAFFLAGAIILNIVESFIPLPFIVPGIKLGLANTISLVLLYYFGVIEFVSIGLLRVVLVGLLRTGLFSTSFLLSLSGFVLSSIVVIIFYLLIKKVSIYGLSVTSAVFHGVGQILMVMIIYNQVNLILYLPILMLSGIVTGLLNAFISSLVLKKLDRHIVYINN